MKSTLLFFAITSLITFFSAISKPDTPAQEAAIHKWADSLEFAYRHEPENACLVAELERKIASGEIQLRRLKESVPAYRKLGVWKNVATGQVFFTSAQ